MATAYFSTVFNHSADAVWSRIRDFNDDRWSGEVTESRSENDKSGSTVGTVRFHRFGDKVARSDLRAYSEVDRFFTYGFVGTPPGPFDDYQATLRVTPIIDGGKAFVEWRATFDCPEARRAEAVTYLNESFARWLGALRADLERHRDA